MSSLDHHCVSFDGTEHKNNLVVSMKPDGKLLYIDLWWNFQFEKGERDFSPHS